MKVHVTDLKPGDRLMTDTFNNVGLHILPGGTVVQREEISLLIRHRVDYVSIQARELPGNAELAGHGLHAEFDEAIMNYEATFLEALSHGCFTPALVDATLQPLLETLDKQKDVVTLLLLLDREDIDTYQHSLQVGLLSYYIAAWLGHSKEECYRISRAGYLHDIGKSQVSLSILNNPGLLNAAEETELKRHTAYGYDIIRGSMKDEATALVALQHHEYEDGSGYPSSLRKADLHPYTEIVTVADIYMKLTTSRLSRPKQGLVSVLRQVHEWGFGRLNGNVVQALTGHLLPGFVGKTVLLSNGETGTIVMNNALDIFKPLVKMNEEYRDLSKERALTVDEVLV
ncbi:HD family phosphohydrolase [Paenibacillus sp. FSL R7-0273]|uniref:HD-GYP domain-containing protein n=1 Tax=Paenibacillus sp. FSL R7-0273 TaxID=1536772 RepID=UPI0004F76924|nr:HD domain-containing phosphohydrolase [Paenibacillus sp. FSL R7-0273]AIQ46664.1 HD family phosphohydrolase [Paenibacillus sp. FSL R7-0273]OMF97568.1 HD family phosphohydrolase [Paenibacillus sp. FSL R7-0273]